MAWLTSLPTGALLRSNTVEERKTLAFFGTYLREITVSVYEYTSMDQNTAETQAALMRADTRDQYGEGTLTTADVERQNEAGAYRIVKTVQVVGAWAEEEEPA